MKPHTDYQSLVGHEQHVPSAEIAQNHHRLWKAQHYATALIAGFAFAGPAVAEAGAPNPQPQPGNSTGGTVDPGPPINLHDCKPNPDFAVSVDDNNQFVWQHNMSRNKAFSVSRKDLGATVLTMDLVYGQVQKYGLKPYVQTEKAATAHGFETQVRLIPTYEPGLGQALSSENPNPELLEKFAHQVATAMGPAVTTYEIWDEPNNVLFLKSESPRVYATLERAGREGILTANSRATIVDGELAPYRLTYWLNRIKRLPSNVLSIHPYGNYIYKTAQYVRQAATVGKRLLESEYGNAPGPHQLNQDREAIKISRCEGADELGFFEVANVRARGGWDTGFYKPPRRHKYELKKTRAQTSAPHRTVNSK